MCSQEGQAVPWRLVGPLMVYISGGISVGDAMITCRGVQTLPCGQLYHIRQERVNLQARGSFFWYRCTKFLAHRAYAICISAPP